jgi:hypothetical protein
MQPVRLLTHPIVAHIIFVWPKSKGGSGEPPEFLK